MAAVKTKTTVKTVRPKVKEAMRPKSEEAGQPTIRSISKKVSRMSLEDRLQIFVHAGLLTVEEAQAAARRPSGARGNHRRQGAVNGKTPGSSS